MENLDISETRMATILLGMSIGSLLGLTLAPSLLHRWGAAVLIVVGFGVLGVALCAIGLATDVVLSITLAVVLMAIFGIMYSLVDVGMNVSGAEVEKEIGKTVMPLMHAFYSFGTIVGAGLGAVAEAINLRLFAHLSFTGI